MLDRVEELTVAVNSLLVQGISMPLPALCMINTIPENEEGDDEDKYFAVDMLAPPPIYNIHTNWQWSESLKDVKVFCLLRTMVI